MKGEGGLERMEKRIEFLLLLLLFVFKRNPYVENTAGLPGSRRTVCECTSDFPCVALPFLHKCARWCVHCAGS